jgi:hypothetical protein
MTDVSAAMKRINADLKAGRSLTKSAREFNEAFNGFFGLEETNERD